MQFFQVIQYITPARVQGKMHLQTQQLLHKTGINHFVCTIEYTIATDK